MSERPEIDLEPAAFRQVFTRPLANPRELWIGIAVCAPFVALGIWGAWYLDTWWSGLFIIPPSILIGIAWAGLEPGYWFRHPPRDDT